MYYRDTIVAGKTILRSLVASSRVKTGKQKRRPKERPTSDAVAKVNFRNALKILTAKINHNFKQGDYHLVLTHKDTVTPQEAKKRLERFLANMRSYCKRNDIDFKWIAVTEYKHTRVHHHIIMNNIDMKVVDKYWKYGYEKPTLLDESGNYYKLAAYLLKETEKTFREESSPSKRRYTSSRNVVMPEVKREKVAGREVNQYIKPPAGYIVDEDTLRKYEHAILKVDCMEYIMVNYDEDKLVKRWRHGSPVNIRQSYRDYEHQLSFYDQLDI